MLLAKRRAATFSFLLIGALAALDSCKKKDDSPAAEDAVCDLENSLLVAETLEHRTVDGGSVMSRTDNISYTYDAQGRMTEMISAYGASGRPIRQTYAYEGPDKVVMGYYDAGGWLWYYNTYHFDAAGNLLHMHSRNADSASSPLAANIYYSYDAEGQLAREVSETVDVNLAAVQTKDSIVYTWQSGLITAATNYHLSPNNQGVDAWRYEYLDDQPAHPYQARFNNSFVKEVYLMGKPYKKRPAKMIARSGKEAQLAVTTTSNSVTRDAKNKVVSCLTTTIGLDASALYDTATTKISYVYKCK